MTNITIHSIMSPNTNNSNSRWTISNAKSIC